MITRTCKWSCSLVAYDCIYVYEKIIYKDLPFVDTNRCIHHPQTCVFQNRPQIYFGFLTSLDILEKPIAHKWPYKPLSWIQNSGV
jgi:hypothetical protein